MNIPVVNLYVDKKNGNLFLEVHFLCTATDHWAAGESIPVRVMRFYSDYPELTRSYELPPNCTVDEIVKLPSPEDREIVVCIPSQHLAAAMTALAAMGTQVQYAQEVPVEEVSEEPKRSTQISYIQ